MGTHYCVSLKWMTHYWICKFMYHKICILLGRDTRNIIRFFWRACEPKTVIKRFLSTYFSLFFKWGNKVTTSDTCLHSECQPYPRGRVYPFKNSIQKMCYEYFPITIYLLTDENISEVLQVPFIICHSETYSYRASWFSSLQGHYGTDNSFLHCTWIFLLQAPKTEPQTHPKPPASSKHTKHTSFVHVYAGTKKGFGSGSFSELVRQQWNTYWDCWFNRES